jgi:hypothetical protein
MVISALQHHQIVRHGRHRIHGDSGIAQQKGATCVPVSIIKMQRRHNGIKWKRRRRLLARAIGLGIIDYKWTNGISGSAGRNGGSRSHSQCRRSGKRN